MNFRTTYFALLLASFACLLGCTTPWSAVKDYGVESHPPKSISDDVQVFIQTKKIPPSDISEIRYGVDGTGRRAVRISQTIPETEGKQISWEYVLYYNKDMVRKKVLKLGGFTGEGSVFNF
jgi:hypothetical protein